RSPDRGSTTGAASWTDHERSEWAARRASEASQSPLTAIFKEELVRKYELFFSHFICLYGSELSLQPLAKTVGFSKLPVRQ
ncbi:hypothetical protein ACVN18_15355, partial [Escherichia coli]